MMFTLPAEAASLNFTNANFYAERKINTRTSLTDSDDGYIAENDDCKIISTGYFYNGTEYWLIDYPTSSGRKQAYAIKNEIVNGSFAVYESKVSQNTIVYRKSDMQTNFGTVYSTDYLFVLADYGSIVQIIYPLYAGGYKIGWIQKSSLYQVSTPRLTSVTVSPTSGTLDDVYYFTALTDLVAEKVTIRFDGNNTSELAMNSDYSKTNWTYQIKFAGYLGTFNGTVTAYNSSGTICDTKQISVTVNKPATPEPITKDLIITAPDTFTLDAGKSETINVSFSGLGIDSIDVQASGVGLSAKLYVITWIAYPGTCKTSIVVSAASNCTGGTVTFQLKNKGLGVILSKTISISVKAEQPLTITSVKVSPAVGKKNDTFYFSAATNIAAELVAVKIEPSTDYSIMASDNLKTTWGYATTIKDEGAFIATFTAYDSSGKARDTRQLNFTVDPAEIVVPVSSLSVEPKKIDLFVGDSINLTATVLPSNATYKKVTYNSNDTKVATVDESGKVTAISVGNTSIYVSMQDGSRAFICPVIVGERPIRVTGISISPATITIDTGKSCTLTPVVSPSNAANKNVTYSSNNSDVATVNSAGIVTGVSGGSATITITTEELGYKATCVVTVNQPVSLAILRFTVSPSSGTQSDMFTFMATTNIAAGRVTIKYYSNESENYMIADSAMINWTAQTKFSGNTGQYTATATAYDNNNKVCVKREVSFTVNPIPVQERTAYVSTESLPLNVRERASESSPIIGKFLSKQQITILSTSPENGFYMVRGTDINTNQVITGYSSAQYISFEKPTSTPESNVMARIAQISQTYKNGSKWNSATWPKDKLTSEQCKGFAKRVYLLLFGFSLPSTQNSVNSSSPAFAYTKDSNLTLIGQHVGSQVTASNIATLLAKARSGDVIQCSKAYNSGAHTYIFLRRSTDGKGMYIYDANGGVKDTIRYDIYVSYADIASVRKGGISLYTATNYK